LHQLLLRLGPANLTLQTETPMIGDTQTVADMHVRKVGRSACLASAPVSAVAQALPACCSAGSPGVLLSSCRAACAAQQPGTHLPARPPARPPQAKLAEHADAFIAIPGGLGTLEELLEVMTWQQLGFHGQWHAGWRPAAECCLRAPPHLPRQPVLQLQPGPAPPAPQTSRLACSTPTASSTPCSS
jgi:hypothetical protein